MHEKTMMVAFVVVQIKQVLRRQCPIIKQNIPPKLFSERLNSLSTVKFPISRGTLPVNLFFDKDKICSCLHLNNVGGIVPAKQFPFRNNTKTS